MISAINSSTSFKAVYKPINYEFSESQQAVIKDIEEKISEKATKMDYCISPYENKVALYRVLGAKQSLHDKTVKFKEQFLCAICDEWNPLDIKKVDETDKKIADGQKTLEQMAGCIPVAIGICIALIVLYLTAGIFLSARNGKNTTKIQTELVNQIDTLKNNFVKKIK